MFIRSGALKSYMWLQKCIGAIRFRKKYILSQQLSILECNQKAFKSRIRSGCALNDL